jgi:hypothetical protein
MRNCRQTQVFCGTAEPFVMDLDDRRFWFRCSLDSLSKALEPSLLDAPFCAFYSCDDLFAAGTTLPIQTE